MRLVLTVVDPRSGRAPVDLEVTAEPGTPASAVTGRLLAAVGRRDGRLYAGDHPVDEDTPLGAPPLLDGAVLTVDRSRARQPRALLRLHVLSGPDAGAVHHLGPGEHAIGRAVEATVRVDDPTLSRLHALVRVAGRGAGGTTVQDLGSTNGTTVDSRRVGRAGRELRPGHVLRVGDTRLGLALPEVVPVSCRPDDEGHRVVNRPPRHLTVPVPVHLTLPAQPTPREPARFPVAASLLPLVAGLVLVAVTRSPAYLLFVLLSPLMALGTFLGERAAGRRATRAARAAYDDGVADAMAAVDRAVADETHTRHLAHPDVVTLMQSATGPRPRLWERRRTDPDALELRLGLGTVPSHVEVRRPAAASGPETVDRPALVDVPVTLNLADAGVLGLAGPRQRLLPVARSLVAQLAGWHSPRDLHLVLLCAERSREWSWVRWLPHLRSGSRALAVALDGTQRRARVEELEAMLDGRAAGHEPSPNRPTTVVVLDGAESLRRDPGIARVLEQGPRVGVHSLCLERDLVSLPAECGATVEVTGPTGTRLRVVAHDSTTYDDIVADGVSASWAHRFARAMAPLRDATPDVADAALPDAARLLDLLPFDASDADAVEAGWRTRPRSTATVLGVAVDGRPVTVDLLHDGPHALVAGTTGSGKSELLQTLIAGLAVGNRPDELSYVLVDYNGGAAFTECARLPHTVGMVTDLDVHLTERALRSLTAELRRRETVLAAAGCADLAGYQEHAPAGAPPVPRLVLVVDEFATLAEDLPDFVAGLVGIAQRGRSLGVHLVLATQRPGGVVGADIRANTSLRIALRVTDQAESIDVVDVRDAAEIGAAHPGRAVVRVASGAVRVVQTARVGGHRPDDAGLEVARVREAPWERAGDPPSLRDGTALPSGPTDLARLVAATRDAAARLGTPAVPSPWLPPLPDTVPVEDLAGLAVRQAAVRLGVVDLPDRQRRDALAFDLEDEGHLLVAGSSRSGRSTVLRTLAGQLAGSFDVTDLHLFVLDGAGALTSLTALPHCGAVVGCDDPVRGDRLLTRLAAEVTRRQRLLADGGLGSQRDQRSAAPPGERLPWLVLLVDGWEAFAAAHERIDHGRPVDTLVHLMREGPAAGLRVVVTGDRALLTSRAAPLATDRLLLRFGDPVDYALAGIPARQVPVRLPAGRALLGPNAAEVQIATLDRDPSAAGQLRALEQVAVRARARPPVTHGHPGLLPLRVEPMPERVDVVDVEAVAKAVAPSERWALLGVGGDELAPVGIDLGVDGPAFVVAGPAGSGRSTTLATMARWLSGRGRPVALVAHRRSPLRALGGEPGVLAVLSPDGSAPLDRLLHEHPEVVVLVDDAETLHDAPIEGVLLGVLAADAEHGGGLVLAGSGAEMATRFRGLTVEACRARTGLLLAPVRPADGDLLGVRVPTGDVAPTGRGVLVVRGRATAVQVARTPL